jgi:putative FmdB family regulatory protein
MPIYEYRCGRCQKEFEVLVRAGQNPSCPECGNEDLQKLLSVPASPSSAERSSPFSPGDMGCGRPECGLGGCQGLG